MTLRSTKGQLILVGTAVENLSTFPPAGEAGVRHEVLNAKNNERRQLSSRRKGAVTVATNMAGRGTDIMLGGNPEFEAVEMRSSAWTRTPTPRVRGTLAPRF